MQSKNRQNISLSKVADELETALLEPSKIKQEKLDGIQNKRIPALVELRSKILAAQQAAFEISGLNQSSYTKWQSNIDDGSVVVTATSTSAPQTLTSFFVHQAASNDTISSSTSIATSKSDAIGTSGSLVVQGQSILIAESDSFAKIAAQISGDVTAHIIMTDNNQHVLQLKHKQTGTPIDLTGTDPNILDALKLNATPTPVDNLRAKVDVNGTTIWRDQNTITDALPGVTLSVCGPSTLGVKGQATVDRAAISTKITSMVEAYNALVDYTQKQTQVDDKGNPLPDAHLHGLQEMRLLKSSILMPASVLGTSGGLFNLGYNLDASGKWILKEPDKLNTASMDAFEETLMRTIRSSNSDFKTLIQNPQYQDADTKKAMRALMGNPVQVTIRHLANDTYEATLSANGIAPLTMPFDPTDNGIQGSGPYAGLYIDYKGASIALNSHAETTITVTDGIASQVNQQMDALLTSRNGQQTALEGLQKEVKTDTEYLTREIEHTKKQAKAKADRVRDQAPATTSAITKYQNVKDLIKAFSRPQRDD